MKNPVFRSGRVYLKKQTQMTANQHIFESGLGLALYLKTYFNEMYENDHSRYVQYSDIICYITI